MGFTGQRLSTLAELNASGDLTDDILKYIMLTYLQVENLAEYSNATLMEWSRQYQVRRRL